MQTFLPHADFQRSAQCLDRARLGKQRVECIQLLRALGRISNGSLHAGWANHPACLMWKGYENSLTCYMDLVIHEWVKRGYKNNIVVPWENMVGVTVHPPWLGDEAFHASHRSNLLRKMPEHYGQFGWTEPSDLPYIWPSKEKKYMTKNELMTSTQISTLDLAGLQTLHSEMCAQASDLGLQLPETLTIEFDDEALGAEICQNVHEILEKHRAGLDEQSPGAKPEDGEEAGSSSQSDGQNDLATQPEQEQVAPASNTKKSSPKKKSSAKSSASKPKADKAAAQPKKEADDMAKTAKKTTPAKKTAKAAPAKKTASAKAAPKAASDNARTPRVKFDDAAKVTWLVDGNPCRAGSGRFDRYELLRKGSGQTVKTLMGKGVPAATLANASAAKIIKIG